MKKIKSILAFAALLLAFTAKSQENQAVLIDKVGDTPLTSYTVRYDKSAKTYSYIGCCGENDALSISEYDGMKMAIITTTYDDGDTKVSEYYADEEAFPVTFMSGSKRGGKEQQERLKVVQKSSEERLVVLNDYVYILKWKSRTDWVIESVYGTFETKGVKQIKESALASKKMEAAKHVETLTAYFESAFAKQDELLPAWQKANAEKIQRRLDNDQKLTDEINGRNNEYWASAEGQRKLKEMQTPKITLVNDTGSDFGIYYGSNVDKILKPGDTHVTDCKDFLGDVYYGISQSGTSQLKEGELLFDADGTNCGTTINISTLLK